MVVNTKFRSMKLYRLLPLFLCLILVGCSDQKKPSSNAEQEQTPPDIHTSQNSLDWEGTYTGTQPCASCEGIETALQIHYDLSYELTIIYLGEDEPNTFETEGTFSWNEAGNTITLENEEVPNQYFVGENYLSKLDMDGNRVTGDLAEHYILSKKQPETE